MPASPRMSETSRLLVADDAALSRKLMQSGLAALGYAVDLAEDGEQAVAMVMAAPYAAVLLDCHMPRLSGYEAAARIRRMPPPKASLPIIGLTAALSVEERDRCLQAGMSDMLPKPVDISVLHTLLQRFLKPAEASADDAIQQGVLEQLRKFPGQDPGALLQDLIAIYLEEAPAAIAQIREAVAANDAPRLNQAAHNLKGSSSSMGIKTMAALCEGLERRGRDGHLGGAQAFVTRLEREYERVVAALTRLQE